MYLGGRENKRTKEPLYLTSIYVIVPVSRGKNNFLRKWNVRSMGTIWRLPHRPPPRRTHHRAIFEEGDCSLPLVRGLITNSTEQSDVKHSPYYTVVFLRSVSR